MSYLQFAANLAFLFVAGCLLEALWPRGLFAGVFAGAGLASAGAFTLLHPDLGLPLAGASGAVAGLMGAVAARFTTVKLRLGPIGAPAVLLLAPWLAAEVLLPPGLDWTMTNPVTSHIASTTPIPIPTHLWARSRKRRQAFLLMGTSEWTVDYQPAVGRPEHDDNGQ